MNHWQKYGVVYFSFAFMAVLMAIHYWLGWHVALLEANEHGSSAHVDEYTWVWARDTIENWQSEVGQVGYQFWLLSGGIAVFGALIWPRVMGKLSAYEKDQEEVKDMLRQILENQAN